MNNYKLKRAIPTILIYLELIIVAIIVIYPVLWIVGSSFNPTASVSSTTIFPKGATFDNYKHLIEKTKYLSWYKNTLYVAVMTMIFSATINTFCAFIFARFRFKGRKAGLLLVMILQMFPSFLSMTAIYMVGLNFGLLNNLNLLVIIYVTGGISGSIWLAQGYMMNIPKSLDEAATIDGATKLQLFVKIIFPLSVPIISFIALTAFLSPWMDFILPRLLISSNEKRTLAVGLFDFITNASSQFTYFAAGAILVAVPITILYMAFQKYLIAGLTSGANKGD